MHVVAGLSDLRRILSVVIAMIKSLLVMGNSSDLPVDVRVSRGLQQFIRGIYRSFISIMYVSQYVCYASATTGEQRYLTPTRLRPSIIYASGNAES